ncbi:MAG: DUF92 domain-containing protein [Cytophagales bacterium]|nr:DUF92 domain-containing protein [Armatimonadota bacterium]
MPGAAQLAAAALTALAISGVAWRVRALSRSGAAAAAGVGFLIFGFGGGPGAAALLLFFVSSSALSRLGKRRKASLDYEKGGEQRDAGQVLANGGVAALCALLIPFLPEAPWLPAAMFGAIAAANADTWATEIGSLAAHPPRLITTLKSAPVGASGAVSLPGTVAALGGALLIGAVALFYHFGWQGVLTATLGGFAGALFDSFLGAAVQVQYRCAVCGKLTERHRHHDQPTHWARGVRWMHNDAVNVLATLCGAIVTASLSLQL